jgi:hypothetical protein
MSTVNCSQHGLGRRRDHRPRGEDGPDRRRQDLRGMAFLCVHAAVAIGTGDPVGFYFDESEAPPLPCLRTGRLQAGQSDPNVIWAAEIELKSVCEHCYWLAKTRHFGDSP